MIWEDLDLAVGQGSYMAEKLVALAMLSKMDFLYCYFYDIYLCECIRLLICLLTINKYMYKRYDHYFVQFH